MARTNTLAVPLSVPEAMRLLDLAWTIHRCDQAITDYEAYGCTASPHHKEHLEMRASAIRCMEKIRYGR